MAVNEEMLILYWNIGKDISNKKMDAQYGSRFFEKLSRDTFFLLPKLAFAFII
ncbi:MAG: hypothetical protein II116_06325 [Ruminococcus sp.]|nr:hypothetical protein [Ruminococcus sp.]